MTKLSERIRPNSEAAPWVINEVKKLEEQNKEMLDSLKRCTDVLMALSMNWYPNNDPFPWSDIGPDIEPSHPLYKETLETISRAVEIITTIEGETK